MEIAARIVTVHRLDLLQSGTDEAVFEAECGKGTYVRAIARDMGRDLGCFGHVSALRRLSVGGFEAADMVTLAALEAAAEAGREPLSEAMAEAGAKPRVVDFAALDEHVLGTAEALSDLYEVLLSDEQASRVLSGNPVLLRGRDAPICGRSPPGS